MSDAPEPLSPAPLPWLGASGEEDGRQPWVQGNTSSWELRVDYTYHGASQHRCERWLFLIRLPYTLGSLLKWIATTIVGMAIANTMRRGLSIASIIPDLTHCTGVAVILELFEVAKRAYAVGKSKEAVGLAVVATADDLSLAGLRSPFGVAWSQITAITYRDGDIFVSPKLTGGKPFAIARTAFADEDTANRFYLALVTLWRSNGNMTALPVEVLAEFRG